MTNNQEVTFINQSIKRTLASIDPTYDGEQMDTATYVDHPPKEDKAAFATHVFVGRTFP